MCLIIRYLEDDDKRPGRGNFITTLLLFIAGRSSRHIFYVLFTNFSDSSLPFRQEVRMKREREWRCNSNVERSFWVHYTEASRRSHRPLKSPYDDLLLWALLFIAVTAARELNERKTYVVNNVKRRRNRTVKNKSCFDIANVVLVVYFVLVRM